MLANTFSRTQATKSVRGKSIRCLNGAAWAQHANEFLSRSVVALFTLAFLVSGCMVGPDYVKPGARYKAK